MGMTLLGPNRRMQLRTGVAAAFMMLLAGVSHAADTGSAAAAEASVVTANTGYKIGDRYGYRTMDGFSHVEDMRHVLRVTGLADNRVIFNDGFHVTDRFGNDVSVGSYNRISAQEVFVPEYRIGKKWTTLYHLSKAESAEFDVTYDFEVVGREKITVPAGTFNAFRIEGEGHMHQLRGYRQGACKEKHSRFTIWVAPDEVRRYVALDYKQRGAYVGCRYSVVARTELVFYEQDGKLVGVEGKGVENYIPGEVTVPEYSMFGHL